MFKFANCVQTSQLKLSYQLTELQLRNKNEENGSLSDNQITY